METHLKERRCVGQDLNKTFDSAKVSVSHKPLGVVAVYHTDGAETHAV